MTLRRPAPVDRQRGAATLVVVMMLFLVMALLAAYANRGILFEQRIANSYYRASMAQEMSEAALEWTVAMLNGTAIDGSCKPVSTGGQRFADRYLNISAEDRGIRQNAALTGIVADCTRTAAGWSCRCPALGTRVAPTAVASSDLVPSFGIAIPTAANQAGTVLISALGCTASVADECSSVSDNTKRYQAVSQQEAYLALVSAVRSPPAAPLVAKGNVSASGTDGLGLYNTSPGSAGLLVTAGGTLSGLQESRMQSVPGTPAAAAQIASDNQLKTSPDRFKMFMGATVARYRQHPSLRTVTCSGDCAPALEDAYKAGIRIMWVNGPMAISSNKVLGSASDPLVVVANGAVTLNGPFQLSGMLVSLGDLSWTNTSGVASLVNGIVLADGNVTTNGRMDIHYQTQVVDQLRNRVGSFVRVPGGWTDSNR